MIHARWWRRAVALLVASGVGGSLLVWPVYVVGLTLGLLTVMTSALLSLVEQPPTAAACAHPVRRLLAQGLAVAAATEATVAVAMFSAPIALGLLLLVLVSSPAAWRLAHGRPLRRPHPPAATRSPRNAPARPAPAPVTSDGPRESGRQALAAMQLTELCVLWRVTFWDLRDATDPEERLAIAVRRQELLDELVRRDPEAMRAWLSSGARPSGGLERFLADRPHHRGSDAA